MRKIVKYSVLHTDLMKIDNSIDMAIKAGWQPYGYPVPTTSLNGSAVSITQCVVKYEEEGVTNGNA